MILRDGRSLPRVRAVSRAISILRAFGAGPPRLTLGEVVRATGLDAGTTRRLLVTLRDEGLVWQDPLSGRYCASVGLHHLARAVPADMSLASLVQEDLQRLADETQTTVFLSSVVGGKARCDAICNGGRAIEVRWWALGEQRPFDMGTGPRVLLAHLSDERRDRFLSEVQARDSARAAALREEVASIRAGDAIVTHDEIAPGLSAAAVPLRDAAGEVVAAISTGGLGPRYRGDSGEQLLAAMRAAAETMRGKVSGAVLISTNEMEIAD